MLGTCRQLPLCTLHLAAALALALFAAGAARATTFSLDVEFDNGTLGSFGTVEVTEVANGDLLFEISLDPNALGAGADLHELYFNLPSAISGVSISSSDVGTTAYDLLGPNPPVSGGAGSDFAWGVGFGNGAGPSGNGVLQDASFVLAASTDLAIADLLIASSTSQGIQVFFAAHVQGTSLPGATSETLGSQIPEPGTLTLGALGLLGLAAASSRRRAPPAD
jgi:hypothetical protein